MEVPLVSLVFAKGRELLRGVENAMAAFPKSSVLAPVVAVLLSVAFAPAAMSKDVIADYSSVMKLEKDASLHVSENITVRFDGQHHGLVREIPISGIFYGHKMNCYIHAGDITCDGGKVETHVSIDHGMYMIKIGSADELLSAGLHRYSIDYNASGAVRLSNDNPELYWNIVGTGWKLPIQQASGQLILPDGVDCKTAKVTCFTGELGSKQKGAFAHHEKTIEFKACNLSPGQGLTMAVQMPPDSVKIPGLISEWLWNLEQGGILLAGLVALILGLWPVALVLFFLFFARGSLVEFANWNSSGGSSLDFGSCGGGFGGGGGDLW